MFVSIVAKKVIKNGNAPKVVVVDVVEVVTEDVGVEEVEEEEEAVVKKEVDPETE